MSVLLFWIREQSYLTKIKYSYQYFYPNSLLMDFQHDTMCNVTAYTNWYLTQHGSAKDKLLSLERLRVNLLDIGRSRYKNMANYEQLYTGRHPETLIISNSQEVDLSTGAEWYSFGYHWKAPVGT